MYRLVALLLSASVLLCAADPNQDLLDAARDGDLPAVKGLLEKGAAIETKTSYGQTPLYLAAMNGHREVVKLLLDKGASTDVRDTFYKAPMLAFVMMRKHFDIAKMLIAKSTGSPDDLLGAVAGSGNPEMVQAVLNKGKPGQASLDKAYEAALERKQAPVAEVLKKAGAHEPAPPVQVDPKVLESYTGTYKSEQLPFDIKVFLKEGKLFIQATGQPELAPKPKSPTTFEFAPAGLVVEFDSPGGFTLKQGGMTFKFRKAVTQ
jgi:hypothetical protein